MSTRNSRKPDIDDDPTRLIDHPRVVLAVTLAIFALPVFFVATQGAHPLIATLAALSFAAAIATVASPHVGDTLLKMIFGKRGDRLQANAQLSGRIAAWVVLFAVVVGAMWLIHPTIARHIPNKRLDNMNQLRNALDQLERDHQRHRELSYFDPILLRARPHGAPQVIRVGDYANDFRNALSVATEKARQIITTAASFREMYSDLWAELNELSARAHYVAAESLRLLDRHPEAFEMLRTELTRLASEPASGELTATTSIVVARLQLSKAEIQTADRTLGDPKEALLSLGEIYGRDRLVNRAIAMYYLRNAIDDEAGRNESVGKAVTFSNNALAGRNILRIVTSSLSEADPSLIAVSALSLINAPVDQFQRYHDSVAHVEAILDQRLDSKTTTSFEFRFAMAATRAWTAWFRCGCYNESISTERIEMMGDIASRMEQDASRKIVGTQLMMLALFSGQTEAAKPGPAGTEPTPLTSLQDKRAYVSRLVHWADEFAREEEKWMKKSNESAEIPLDWRVAICEIKDLELTLGVQVASTTMSQTGSIEPAQLEVMEKREVELTQTISDIGRAEREIDCFRLKGSQAMRQTFIALLWDHELQMPKMTDARTGLADAARFLIQARKDEKVGPEIDQTITIFIERLKQTKQWLSSYTGM